MSFSLSKRSLAALSGVHPDLIEVVKLAGQLTVELEKGIDFIITQGCRSLEEQKQMVAKGASQTMHSRHLGGFAVDYVALVDGRVTYAEESMKAISDCFLEASARLGIPVIWGGIWKTLHDTPHIELDKKRYPDVSDT